MNKVTYLIIFAVLLFTGCSKNESTDAVIVDGTPIVKAESSYTVLTDEDITYAEGLSHNASSTTPFSIPLKLDIYTPDNNSENRPVFMFIHGGGFRGGTKTKPEIVEMANYYASRG
jgi:para-nitrobenzyl esterase